MYERTQDKKESVVLYEKVNGRNLIGVYQPVAGMEEIERYLADTAYAGGAEALSESASAFERWCDNRIIETIKPQKYNPFTVGPIVAYILARLNEIKTVRIILTCKLNQLPEEAIRERVREMYV